MSGNLEVCNSKGSQAASECNRNNNNGSLCSERQTDDLTFESRKDFLGLCASDKLVDNPSSASYTSKSANSFREVLQMKKFAMLAQKQPKITYRDVIDLAADSEKKNPDDDWFERKFKQNPKVEKIFLSDLAKVKEDLKNRHISPCTAQLTVQASLAQKLSEKRRREQEKRKALYDADNETVNYQSSPDPDLDEVTSEEGSRDSESHSEELEDDMSKKDDVKVSACDFINDEADESDADEYENEETVTRENENAELAEEEKDVDELDDEKKKLGTDKKDNADDAEEASGDTSSVLHWWKDWMDVGMPTYSQLFRDEEPESEAQTRTSDNCFGEEDALMALEEATDLCTEGGKLLNDF